MSVPPNEYLNLLQGMNQPMPERNFTPGPGMGPVAMPQPVQEVYLDQFPQPVVPQVQAPIQPMQAPMQAPSPFSYGGMEESLLRSAGLQAQAGRGLMRAQQEAAQEEQNIYRTQKEMLEGLQEKQNADLQDYEKKVVPAMSNLQALGQEIQGAKYEGFWAKKSTAQKIGGALAIGLGALGAGLTGGQNYAMQIIDKAVDDDYRNWQANIDAKNKSFLNQRQYINDLQNDFKDKQQLALAYKALAYDRANAQLNEIAAKRKELEALPNFQLLKANIQDNRNKTYLELAKLKAETAKAEREAAPTAPGGGVVQALQAVPKEFQSEAYKELKSVTEYNKVQEDVVNAFKDAENISLSAAVPGFLGGNSEAYDAWVAKIAGAIVGKVPGIKSDQDFRAIVKPMLPTWTDTNRVAELKKQNMIGFLRSQSPSAPILNSFGYNLAPNFNQQQAQPVTSQQRITPALQAQAQAQLQAATQALQKNPNDAVAKQVLERAKLILGQ